MFDRQRASLNGPPLPDPDQTQRRIESMRRTFGRTLAGWVGDLLVIERSGDRRPVWTDQATTPSWLPAA